MTIHHRNGQTNGESNEEEQAEDVQVVAHLRIIIVGTIHKDHKWKRNVIKIPTMASFNKFD